MGKTTSMAATKTKSLAPATSKLTYKEMIQAAIVSLKERAGSSRQALKKYVQTNFNITAHNFDSLFNIALRKGVDTGDFLQPKGASGPVKMAKKLVAAKTAKVTKPEKPKKATTAKKEKAVKAIKAKPPTVKSVKPKAATKKVAKTTKTTKAKPKTEKKAEKTKAT